MTTHTFSRRLLLKGAGALACTSSLAPLGTAAAQTTPVPLNAAPAQRPELAGQGPLALFNDALPGPLLRVRKGDPLAVQLQNGLSAPLSLVWHGVRTTKGAAPTAAVAPGAQQQLTLVPRDAGTYWYHAAAPAQAHRALAGPLVVLEPGAPAYDSDHVLFIQGFPPASGLPLFPVNGAISPTFEGPADGRTRLRLINATPLFLPLRVDAPAAYVIAVDGQPAEPFAPKDNRLQLAPGGRIDLAVSLGDANPARLLLDTAAEPVQLAIVSPVGAGGTPADGPPPPLPANDLPKALPFADAARFTLKIGEATAAPIGPVKTGQVVVLTLENALDTPVAVRIDGHPVRLLDAVYDGWSPWWHDTLPVAAKSTRRIAFLADTPGQWAIVAQRGGDGATLTTTTYQVTA